jgi:hypothetical protein
MSNLLPNNNFFDLSPSKFFENFACHFIRYMRMTLPKK